MRKTFRIIAFILLFVLSFSLVACNSEQNGETDSTNATDEATEETEKATKKPATEKVTETPTKLENTDGLDLNIKVLSQNVLCADNAEHGTVLQRTTRFKALIDEYQPDIIGTQEVTFEWFKYLRTIKEYGIVGSSRNGHKQMSGEWSAIMYSKERFVLMDEDTFWLTATPDEVSMTEGAKCKRICTWAELFDTYTGQTIIMANTHLDHSTDAVRTMQSNYLLRHLKQRLGDRYDNCSIYLTGDFNFTADTTPYDTITRADFIDSHTVAETDASTVGGTYHNFGKKEREIDFCFYRGEETVLEYEVISQNYASEGESEPGYVSDHYGVLVTFKKEG